jgi:hypothetical protein
MILKKLFLRETHVAFALGSALAVTLTGCIVDGPRARVYVAPPVVEAPIVVQDDYVYYPGYDMYYSSNRHQYLWLEGGAWVTRPQPRGVSVNVLLGSPSVRMDFHDSPAFHHAEMVRRYPRNWAPPGGNHGQKEIRRDDNHDNHEGK